MSRKAYRSQRDECMNCKHPRASHAGKAGMGKCIAHRFCECRRFRLYARLIDNLTRHSKVQLGSEPR